MMTILNDLAQAWWAWSLAMFWQVGILIVFVACVDALLRRWAWPHLRYALWLMILAKLVLPPSVHLSSSLVARVQPTTSRWVAQAETQSPKTVAAPPRMVATRPVYRPQDVSAPSSPVLPSRIVPSVTPATPTVKPSWQTGLMLLWLAGMLCLGLWLLRKLSQLRKTGTTRRGTTPLPESFYLQAQHCATRLNLRICPPIIVTNRVTVPAVMGVFRPTLLIPPGFLAGLSRKDTEHMLLHEFAHIKRGDLKVQGLTLMLQIAYWYNPLLWLVSRQLHHLRELCCDASVAQYLRERTGDYRQTLLDIARRYLAHPLEPGLGLLGLFEDSNRLAVRLTWLKKKSWRYPRTRFALILILITVMGLCILPMAQAKPSSPEQKSKPAQAKTKELKQQKKDRLIEELNKQKAELETELARLKAEKSENLRRSSTIHSIEAGESLATIARRYYGRTAPLKEAIDTLLQANPDCKADGLRAGQKLHIPSPTPTATTPPSQAQPDRDWEEELDHWIAQIQQMNDQLNEMIADLNISERLEQANALRQEWINNETFQKWQGEFKQWQQSPEVQNWQTELATWSRKAKQLAKDKWPGKKDSQRLIPPTAPPLPSLPKIQSALTLTPDETHTLTALVVDFPQAPDAKLTVKNAHGSIYVSGNNSKDTKTSVTFHIQGMSRTEAEKIIHPIAEAMGSDGKKNELIIQAMLPKKKNYKDVCIDIEIEVPPQAHLDLNTNVGTISLTDTTGTVQAHSNLGTIRLDSVTGDIDCRTNLGTIALIAPNEPSMQVSASTHLGSIKTDLDLVEQAQVPHKSLQGTLGQGTQKVNLRTNLGAIYIGTPTFIAGQQTKEGTKPKGKQATSSVEDPLLVTSFKPAVSTQLRTDEDVLLTTPIRQEGNYFIAEKAKAEIVPQQTEGGILILNQNGTVTVIGTDRQDCLIKSNIRSMALNKEEAQNTLEQIQISAGTIDSRLKIEPKIPEKLPSGRRVIIDLILEVPSNTALEILHEDGNTNLRNLLGPTKIVLEDGDIQVWQHGGPLTIRHEDGSIRIDELEGPLKIKLEDGFIHANALHHDIDIKLEDGAAKLNYAENCPNLSEIKVIISDGAIKLNVPENLLGPNAPIRPHRSNENARWQHNTDKLDINLRVNDGTIKVNRE